MSVRIMLLGSVILIKVKKRGTIPIAWLRTELKRNFPFMTDQQFLAAVDALCATGDVERTFGGSALSRT